jgi:hypothetical protein
MFSRWGAGRAGCQRSENIWNSPAQTAQKQTDSGIQKKRLLKYFDFIFKIYPDWEAYGILILVLPAMPHLFT